MRLIFDRLDNIEREDRGATLTLEYTGELPELFVRLISLDPSGTHAALEPFVGRDIRIVAEVVGPKVTGHPEDLDDESLERAYAQAVSHYADLARVGAEAMHPARNTLPISLDLIAMNFYEAERRLEALADEIHARAVAR